MWNVRVMINDEVITIYLIKSGRNRGEVDMGWGKKIGVDIFHVFMPRES